MAIFINEEQLVNIIIEKLKYESDLGVREGLQFAIDKARELANELNEHDETDKAMFDMGYDYGFDFAAKACKPDWIPCEERLPEEDKMVIVCCFGNNMIMPNPGESLEDLIKRARNEIVTVTMGFIGSDVWYCADWCPMIVTPTYWMPLPEPPEVSEDE